MSEPIATNQRRRLKYSIIGAVGFISCAQLAYNLGWSGRYGTESNDSSIDNIANYPQDTIEGDRACILLDRSFTPATQPDFTKSNLKQWTECRTLNTTAGWIVQHCATPGSNSIQKEGEPLTVSPSCYPGGYFRIQRLQPPANEDNLQAGTCQLKATVTLSNDAKINQYASMFLGPDTFRIVLAGPERISLVQQQSLGDCTYAVPYLISRPGRFWVQKIIHTYQAYDALNEMKSEQWSPQYLGSDLIEAEARRQHDFYHFDVCPHCVDWVAMDESLGLGGTKDVCSRAPNRQSRQYGTYNSRVPIKSVRQAISHPYEWIPVRPRCMFYPAQTSFQSATESDSKEVKADKIKAAQCLERPRSIYFVGDSHVRALFNGVMQRLRGRPGSIDTVTRDRRSYSLKAGKVVARNDLDDNLDDTLAHIRYLVNGEEGKGNIPDIGLLEDIDTIVFGFGSFSGHWTTSQFQERIKQILDGLISIWKTRQIGSGNKSNNLKVIWMGMPASTDSLDGGSVADWKTNHRVVYWNKIVDGMIYAVNNQVSGEGMIDRLSTFEITIPFRNSTIDHIHYTNEVVVDSLSAELIHKLDLCS
ncbi:hypothetical protein BGX21_010197 [Mortierella sp. AD011]|nr:hypothetical protein BGX20_006030 [Mortierella sp. AD010]KAF9402411.1 hypothetical protein BGX21_010197 [Mortierella sp. AD011]